MTRYRCPTCGYVYDEQKEGRKCSELPENWGCPVCGEAGSSFEALGPESEKPVRSALGTVAMAHRVFGYVFLAIYVVLIWQMVPRLWAYQIEFPARTVVHMSLGMAIGVILFLKIAIVRFFRRLDAALVPAFGTSLLVASVVLIGIAVPPAFREALATGRLFEEENRRRVEGLLLQTELDRAQSARLATPKSLLAGQRVLRQRCVECHDLRTVLAKPRTPDAWRQTVRRMADRTTLLDPLTEQQQWQVTAYLVALSPQLQQSVRQLREQQERRNETKQAAAEITTRGEQSSSYDGVLAKRLFETKCSGCHKTTLVEQAPPDSEDAARELVMRMVQEGLTAREEEQSQIVGYLIETYVKKSEP
ncbi:MAG: rubredoxin [Planctomycetota bacterium]